MSEVTKQSLETEETSTSLPEKISRLDMEPKPIPAGGTEIVLQRHGKYIRDKESNRKGSLTEEAELEEKENARRFFESFLENIPEDERDDVEVIFFASDTSYEGGGRRSYETAQIAEESAREVFDEHGIATENILNIKQPLRRGDGPRPMTKLREPNFLNEGEYRPYLADKYGDLSLDFWIAFEEDLESEKRIELGAEGPDDIADRTLQVIKGISKFAEKYHESNPEKRLIIWMASHYDTISPLVKRHILNVSKEVPLMVDYGAGITIDIDTDGRARTVIGEELYNLDLTS